MKGSGYIIEAKLNLLTYISNIYKTIYFIGVKIYINIVEYLNEKAGTKFKADIRKTRDLIKARLKEGYLDIDFFTVIDTKVKEWINNKEMKKYLRPETLFGTKFEGYLNQAGEVKSEVINLPFIEEDM